MVLLLPLDVQEDFLLLESEEILMLNIGLLLHI